MSLVSPLHHLFNPATCQSYIHTLRWQDRPLQCPRCQSLNVGPWGTYHAQPGLKRYRCKEQGCQRTFNDLTGTLLDGSKRSVMHWILVTFLLCLSCSSRRIARELGVHVRTSYRWCWWLRNAALSYEIGRKLALDSQVFLGCHHRYVPHDLIRPVFQGRGRSESPQLTLNHVFLGTAKSKHLV